MPVFLWRSGKLKIGGRLYHREHRCKDLVARLYNQLRVSLGQGCDVNLLPRKEAPRLVCFVTLEETEHFRRRRQQEVAKIVQCGESA